MTILFEFLETRHFRFAARFKYAVSNLAILPVFIERDQRVQLRAARRREVDLALQTDKSLRNRGLVDVYNEKVQEHGDPTHLIFTDARLVGNVGDYMLGATAVVALFLHSHVLNFAAHVDSLQAALQREIDGVVGRDRLPSWPDHVRMPLTMATIWEMYRWKACTPFGLPRGAAEDTTIGGYHVPKGSVVVANYWAVHMSPKLWKDPENFDPSRFLKPDGSATTTRPEHIIAFSIGIPIAANTIEIKLLEHFSVD
ncbi:hypothetical protein HPB48_014790 [Haemaphysalis longicornis]|uniref:Cytochrome P450 n=1 Tax=Haemaphysalis longicornis TaxID=44386 RepID=A0A9J6GDM7_HAELO|nr:hypothetical protein HPB48_014790 [Haemaphysalis longicornis]